MITKQIFTSESIQMKVERAASLTPNTNTNTHLITRLQLTIPAGMNVKTDASRRH